MTFTLRRVFLRAADVREHRTDLLGHVFHARRPHDFHAGRGICDVDFDFLVVERAFAQTLAERLARGVAAVVARLRPARRRAEADLARGRQQDVEDAVFGASSAFVRTFCISASRVCLTRDFDQVADDAVDVAADVADFGELGRFDLDERRVGELGEAPRDFGLADAGRPDHQDVLRRDFLAQRLGDLLTAPAVAQRDRRPRASRGPGR